MDEIKNQLIQQVRLQRNVKTGEQQTRGPNQRYVTNAMTGKRASAIANLVASRRESSSKPFVKPSSDKLELSKGRLEYMIYTSPCSRTSTLASPKGSSGASLVKQADFASKLTRYLAYNRPK